MKISPLKSRVLTFKGQVKIRSKIIIDNITLEKANMFTYLECKISYEEKKSI